MTQRHKHAEVCKENTGNIEDATQPGSWFVQSWRWLARAWRRKPDPHVVYSQSAEEMRAWQARARLFMIVLVVMTLTACVTPAVQPASPVAVVAPAATAPALLAEPTPVPAEVLATLDTEAQLELVELPRRDPVQLTERLNPAIGVVPLLAEPKHYAVGDRESFWVHNSDAKRNIEIEADLIYQTDVANIWVEAAQSFDAERIKRSIDRFSRVAYPALVRTFGREANPGVDGDPRLHVLHTAQMGAGVAGYFYSADKYTTAVNPFSNEKEIFFINLDWLNRLGDYTVYETVLAHEFQHMIHWSQDRGEDLWLNEGLSEYAQEVAQYDPDLGFAYAFLADPDLSLATWSADPHANAPHYGASYLFVAYLAQRFGDDFLSRLVAEQSNGAVGINHALAAAGADVAFDDLFADWVVANWADDPGALEDGGRYGYRRIDLSEARAAATIASYPVAETAAKVFNYGTDYLVLNGEGNLVFDFQGDLQTRLADLPPGDDARRWWSNRGDDANPRLTRQFDLSGLTAGAPVTMTVDAWWRIEETYDYGYVMASRDGEEWTILPGQHTRTDNPTGNALGAGYTGVSGDGDTPGWVQEVYDLSAFTGGPLWVQFSYVTDDAVNTEGWFVDNVAIPALGYANDFAGDAAGWTSEGWVLTDNQLPQRWLLQWMTFDSGRLTGVTRVPVKADGSAQIKIGELGGQRTVVIAISALTPITTEPAAYKYWIEDRN